MLASGGPCAELDFAELFAGEARVSHSLAALGYRGRAFDADRHRAMDFMEPLGLLMALRAAMSLRPGGTMWLAPPCSSWAWLTRHSSGRHLITEGDVTLQSIVVQNALVERACLILEVLHSRGCFYIVEQPASSVLWDYAPMAAALRRHGAARCALDVGSFAGGASVKPTVLWGTAPYLHGLDRRCCRGMRVRLQLEGVQTTKRLRDKDGLRRCQGTADLKGTQAYPWGWGAAHALAFQDHYGPPQALGTSSPASHAAVVASLRDKLPGLRNAWWLRDFLGEPL